MVDLARRCTSWQRFPPIDGNHSGGLEISRVVGDGRHAGRQCISDIVPLHIRGGLRRGPASFRACKKFIHMEPEKQSASPEELA